MLIRKDQDITDDFLALNAAVRENNGKSKSGEYVQLASIPTIVVEKWMNEGFNIYDPNITAGDIQKKLYSEDMTAFLTSNMRVS